MPVFDDLTTTRPYHRGDLPEVFIFRIPHQNILYKGEPVPDKKGSLVIPVSCAVLGFQYTDENHNYLNMLLKVKSASLLQDAHATVSIKKKEPSSRIYSVSLPRPPFRAWAVIVKHGEHWVVHELRLKSKKLGPFKLLNETKIDRVENTLTQFIAPKTQVN